MLNKLKEWAVVIALITSGLSIKVSYTNEKLEFELERAKQALAEQQSSFGLAGVCD